MLSKNTPDVGTEQQDGSKLRRDELMAKIYAVQALPSLRARLLDNSGQRKLKGAASKQYLVVLALF